jgi:hypothetical protein
LLIKGNLGELTSEFNRHRPCNVEFPGIFSFCRRHW